MKAGARLAKAREVLANAGAGALAIEGPANVTYLTGFDGVFDAEPSSVCIITPEIAQVHVDSRYVEAARAAAEGTPWTVVGPCSDVWDSALRSLDSEAADTLALDAAMPHSRFTAIAAKRAGRVVMAEGWVEGLRQVKEDVEVERMTRAAAIGDAAFDHILGVIAPGVTEAEIALELEHFMRRRGSDGVAFPSIVASGPNSSRPHAHATQRALERGDLLTLDFGARVGGYCSDMTRTVVLGRASERQREIHSVVLASNEAGLSAVRPGRTGAEIDAVAREVIAHAGFGEHFGHGLGHGVGLEVHEDPRVGPKGLEAVPLGAVITIEPGVYVPGVGGARIEDLVAVAEGGAVVLTRAPKDLIEL